jgi:hypothetical protein
MELKNKTQEEIEKLVHQCALELEKREEALKRRKLQNIIESKFWKKGSWQLVLAMPHQDSIMFESTRAFPEVVKNLHIWENYPVEYGSRLLPGDGNKVKLVVPTRNLLVTLGQLQLKITGKKDLEEKISESHWVIKTYEEHILMLKELALIAVE